MRSHYSVVHEEFKPYGCSMCNFRAPKSFRVTSHIEKAHGGQGAVIHDTKMRPKSVSPTPRYVSNLSTVYNGFCDYGYSGQSGFSDR